jgi:hypothetical protein
LKDSGEDEKKDDIDAGEAKCTVLLSQTPSDMSALSGKK